MRAKSKNKWQKIQITNLEAKSITIGKFDANSCLFKMERSKEEHFNQKLKAWGLEKRVVDFLSSKQADVLLKDKDTKWEYKCSAKDFLLYGILNEPKDSLPVYFLSIDKWEVTKANQRSYVVKCQEEGCRYNFANNCMKGTISIDKNGGCLGYVDK